MHRSVLCGRVRTDQHDVEVDARGPDIGSFAIVHIWSPQDFLNDRVVRVG
jgi:hypothetical protein